MSAQQKPGGFDSTADAFVAASAVLQDLQDRPPPDPVTLQAVMARLQQQSFGMIMLILGVVAAAPGVSVLAGFVLLIATFQMMLGHSALKFPGWLAKRKLPTRQIRAVVQRAIPILVHLERAIYPRLPTPPEWTQRVVGAILFLLTVRLLVGPFPLSNVVPAILIAFISLTYLERDGALLIAALLGACLFLVVEFAAMWHLLHAAKWFGGTV